MAVFGRFREEKNLLPMLGIEPRFLGCSVPSVVTKPTMLSKQSDGLKYVPGIRSGDTRGTCSALGLAFCARCCAVVVVVVITHLSQPHLARTCNRPISM
jgi:hypothetical protein